MDAKQLIHSDLFVYHLCKAIEHALCAARTAKADELRQCRSEQAEELRQCLCRVTGVAA